MQGLCFSRASFSLLGIQLFSTHSTPALVQGLGQLCPKRKVTTMHLHGRVLGRCPDKLLSQKQRMGIINLLCLGVDGHGYKEILLRRSNIWLGFGSLNWNSAGNNTKGKDKEVWKSRTIRTIQNEKFCFHYDPLGWCEVMAVLGHLSKCLCKGWRLACVLVFYYAITNYHKFTILP